MSCRQLGDDFGSDQTPASTNATGLKSLISKFDHSSSSSQKVLKHAAAAGSTLDSRSNSTSVQNNTDATSASSSSDFPGTSHNHTVTNSSVGAFWNFRPVSSHFPSDSSSKDVERRFETKIRQQLNEENLGTGKAKASSEIPTSPLPKPQLPPKIGLPVTNRTPIIISESVEPGSSWSPVGPRNINPPEIPPRNSTISLSHQTSIHDSATNGSSDVILTPQAIEKLRQDLNRLQPEVNNSVRRPVHKVTSQQITSNNEECEFTPKVALGSKSYRLLPLPSVQAKPPTEKPPKPYTLNIMSTAELTELCRKKKMV